MIVTKRNNKEQFYIGHNANALRNVTNHRVKFRSGGRWDAGPVPQDLNPLETTNVLHEIRDRWMVEGEVKKKTRLKAVKVTS